MDGFRFGVGLEVKNILHSSFPKAYVDLRFPLSQEKVSCKIGTEIAGADRKPSPSWDRNKRPALFPLHATFYCSELLEGALYDSERPQIILS